MKIISLNELTKDERNNSYDFRKIHITSKYIVELAENLKQDDFKIVVDKMNVINDQGIVSMELPWYTVDEKGKKKSLSITSLSSSERLFFVCALADLAQHPILIYDEIYQLTKKTLKKFYNTFKNSKYIYLTFNDIDTAEYYKELLNGGRLWLM